MEYRFSLTPRLMVLGAVCLAALLALLFALGYVTGQRLAQQAGSTTQAAAQDTEATGDGDDPAPAAAPAPAPASKP